MKKLSIVVPCYNEEEAIPFFYEEIDKVSKSMKNDFEFITSEHSLFASNVQISLIVT